MTRKNRLQTQPCRLDYGVHISDDVTFFFFFQILFNLQLVEFADAEPTDLEGQLHKQELRAVESHITKDKQNE